MASSAGTMTVALNLDTTQFDRQIRRVRRQAWLARVWSVLWLAIYAAVMTGATITLAVVELTR